MEGSKNDIRATHNSKQIGWLGIVFVSPQLFTAEGSSVHCEFVDVLTCCSIENNSV